MKQVKEMSYVIDAEESKRINIIKFLSIIFVVFIHAYSNDVSFAGGMVELAIPDWLKALEFIGSRIIAECAVPMFFLLSAILLFRRQRGYIDTLRSRVYTLGIPYVCCGKLKL